MKEADLLKLNRYKETARTLRTALAATLEYLECTEEAETDPNVKEAIETGKRILATSEALLAYKPAGLGPM